MLVLLDICTISDFVKGDSNTLGQIKNHCLLIGATAITHNLKLITANPQEFARIQGLSWENWR